MATVIDAPATSVTAAEFAEAAADFEGPVELVRGEIVEMPQPKPPHGTICANICSEIQQWAKRSGLGVPSMADGVQTEDRPDSVRAPDVFFTPYDRLPDRKAPSEWYEVPPSLCVEVISDSERWGDVQGKTSEYLAFGVDEVWLVEQDLRTLTIVRGDVPMRTVRGEDVVASAVLPGFESKLTDFFWNC